MRGRVQLVSNKKQSPWKGCDNFHEAVKAESWDRTSVSCPTAQTRTLIKCLCFMCLSVHLLSISLCESKLKVNLNSKSFNFPPHSGLRLKFVKSIVQGDPLRSWRANPKLPTLLLEQWCRNCYRCISWAIQKCCSLVFIYYEKRSCNNLYHFQKRDMHTCVLFSPFLTCLCLLTRKGHCSIAPFLDRMNLSITILYKKKQALDPLSPQQVALLTVYLKECTTKKQALVLNSFIYSLYNQSI